MRVAVIPSEARNPPSITMPRTERFLTWQTPPACYRHVRNDEFEVFQQAVRRPGLRLRRKARQMNWALASEGSALLFGILET